MLYEIDCGCWEFFVKLERSQDVVLLQAIHLILLRSALVSLITISYFEGSGKGADPNRQPCRKAKEVRKERKLLKAAQDQVIPPAVHLLEPLLHVLLLTLLIVCRH